MTIKISIEEYSIKDVYQCMTSIRGEDDNKKFPIFTIGKDSYVGNSSMEFNADERVICNVHIGRYTSIAGGALFLIDQNHDYRKVCQGRILGVDYRRPEYIRRKGQLIIMNDCWAGENVTFMSGVVVGNGAVIATGAVVTKNVPPYAIVGGNPAKVIGYRFTPPQIEALKIIRWWNWDDDTILARAGDLYGDIDSFIEKHLPEAEGRLKNFRYESIPHVSPAGDVGSRYLYIPDFEQQFPTYPHVIEEFVESHAGTNDELLLFVKTDDNVEQKIEILDHIFEQYRDADCYVNLVEGLPEDIDNIFNQSDYFITNRSVDTIQMVDKAEYYGIPVLSGVDMPIF